MYFIILHEFDTIFTIIHHRHYYMLVADNDVITYHPDDTIISIVVYVTNRLH